MSTLTQLRVRVRQILKLENQTDTDEGDPSQSEITTLLNDCRNRVWMRLGTSSTGKRIATQTTMTYTASAETVALPSAAQMRMIYTVAALAPGSSSALDRYFLDPVVADEFDQFWAFGVPEAYLINQQAMTIAVRPVPQTAYTLYLQYHAALAQLASNSDTPSELPSEFHHMYAYGAAAQYLTETNDDVQYANMIAERFEKLYEDTQAYINATYPVVHFQRKDRRA